MVAPGSPTKSSAIAKGLLTFVLPAAFYCKSGGRTQSARYCYSVFLRHLSMLRKAGADTDPKIVAELGPGTSIGVGYAALIAGADAYYGFDVKAYAKDAGDAALFDELAGLFARREAVPDDVELPEIKPKLEDHAFPADILTDSRLARALAPDRLAALRSALFESGGEGGPASYVVPWDNADVLRPASVDWIFSQAVLEHVDDVDGTYATCFSWLRPGGCMSHQIDFRSHGTANEWNGHWAYSDLAWRAVRGARPYLINRLAHSAHRASLSQAGFSLTLDRPVERPDGIERSALARRHQAITDADLRTSGAFMISARPRQQTAD